ncbi:MAG: hypothetical protein E7107_15790 [Prevotella sp.]|jgi:hypothetical protein|nr:hypothetical protein [Prevotella sp.]
MEENSQKNVVNHFAAGSNCQVFNGNITGCTFAMPGSSVTQLAAAHEAMAEAVETAGAVEIPEVLANSELWKKLVDAGLVDANGQPTVSRPEAALMADMIAERLGIAYKWKLFEMLWHRNNMRSDYNTALNQRKSIAFQEKIKKLFS